MPREQTLKSKPQKEVSFAADIYDNAHKNFDTKYPDSCIPNDIEYKSGRNEKCSCSSGKKFKKCCLNKQNEIIIQELDKIKIDKELYGNIELDMRSKYIKEFGEIKTGNLIPIIRENNIKRHAAVIAFWLREASNKDYDYKENNMHKFAMCSKNASNLIERSHKMGFLSEVVDELEKIYEGYLYFNKRAIQLLQQNNFDIDFNIPSLVVD